MTTEEGVLYVVTGEKLRSEAEKSAQRVDKLTDLPISIVTDQEPEVKLFDDISLIDDPAFSIRDKVMNLELTYDKTIFLDTDTYLCDADGIHDLLEFLDQVDVAAAHDEGRNMELVYGNGPRVPNVKAPEAFPMLNTGVLALANRPQTKNLLQRWRDLYDQHDDKWSGLNDQGAFRQAVIESNAELGTFPPEYNFRAPKPQYVFGSVKLVHGHAPNLPEIAETINSNPSERRIYRPVMRLSDPTEFQYIYPQINPGTGWAGLTRLWLTFKEDGLIRTALMLGLGGLDTGRSRFDSLTHSLRNQGIRSTFRKIRQNL